jgi:hypothetical protein
MTRMAALTFAAAMIVGLSGSARANDSFKTLSGIEAEPLSSAALEGVTGKFFVDPWGNLYDLFGGVYLTTATPNQYVATNNQLYNYDGANLWDPNNQFWFNMFYNVGLADGRLFSLAAGRELGRWY